MDHLAINVQSFVPFCLAITELLDFKVWKIGQNLHANMEGFRRDSHICMFTFLYDRYVYDINHVTYVTKTVATLLTPYIIYNNATGPYTILISCEV